MAKTHSSFTLSRFLSWSAKMAGRPITFVFALGFVLIWFIIGWIWGFSNTWLLIIDTIATINASLIAFIIQHTQNRDTKALHLKLDELLNSLSKTERELIAIEEKEEEELDKIKKTVYQKRKRNNK